MPIMTCVASAPTAGAALVLAALVALAVALLLLLLLLLPLALLVPVPVLLAAVDAELLVPLALVVEVATAPVADVVVWAREKVARVRRRREVWVFIFERGVWWLGVLVVVVVVVGGVFAGC